MPHQTRQPRRYVLHHRKVKEGEKRCGLVRSFTTTLSLHTPLSLLLLSFGQVQGPGMGAPSVPSDRRPSAPTPQGSLYQQP